MAIRRRRPDRSRRAKLYSPGRTTAGRVERRQFWVGIAAGLSSEEAAVAARVSSPVGYDGFGRLEVCRHRN
jgi:hypothetical protein